MNFRLSLRRGAVSDMAAAEAYYAAQQPGLEIRFRNEVAAVVQKIEVNPRLFPYSEKLPYRKAVLSVFPFCIYYAVANDVIFIIAVHDTRRDPRRWQQRTPPG